MGTLAFLTQLDSSNRLSNGERRLITPESDLLVRWILERQTTYVEEPDEDEEDDSIDPAPASFKSEITPNSIASKAVDENLTTVGFNGRPNKVADTCYCWWNLGSLAVRLHILHAQKQC